MTNPAPDSTHHTPTDVVPLNERWWYIALFMLFFCPIGVFLAVTHPHWSARIKWMWIGVFVAVMFVISLVARSIFR